jgi:hypothetical protein
MARKKIVTPGFYIYYDKKTGEILSVTNEHQPKNKNSIEVPFETYDLLVSGKKQFTDYEVGKIKTDDGKTVVRVILKSDQAYVFKNTMFEVISKPPTDETELIVSWNPAIKHWVFLLTDTAKARIDESLKDTTLIFFIILEEDFNLVIRTILISYWDLFLKSNVYIPFEHDIENKIDKISVATKLTLESYGLTVND